MIENFGSYEILDPLTRVFTLEHFINYVKFYHSLAQRKEKQYNLVKLRLENYAKICGEKSNEICNYAVLKLVSVLKKSLRIPLDVIGRISQDTFSILIVEVDKTKAEKIMDRVLSSVKDGFVINNTSVQTDLSCDFASFPDDIKTIDDIERFLEV